MHLNTLPQKWHIGYFLAVTVLVSIPSSRHTSGTNAFISFFTPCRVFCTQPIVDEISASSCAN
jgi:hypothetical protein